MKYPWFKPKINQNKYIKNLKDVVRSNANGTSGAFSMKMVWNM